ncbi:MAG: sorbosone dehydrogenase family protein [Haloarculaceae archaeon]
MDTTRRRFLATAGAGLAALGAAPSASAAIQQNPVPAGPTVGLERVASGLASPTGVEVAPGDDRLFVLDQPGRVYAVGEGSTTTVLDLRDQVVVGGLEQGLLGLAFHPDGDGRFYVRYSAPRRSGTPTDYSHTFVLSEFRMGDDGTAVPGSERTVLEIAEPQANHNAGAIAFGPDGYLYVAVGDGGAGGDQGTGHVQDWYDGVGGGNGQDVTDNLRGSVLRIDVDGRDGDRAYGIPDDNPLVGQPGLDEHFAWGFRNPWRLSFDGDRLLVGDVGQSTWEEVDVVEKGGNYGWNVREGAHCFGARTCPTETSDGQPLIDPVIEYPHERDGTRIGLAVVGGYVYRQSTVPALRDRYVFGDWSRSFKEASGTLFVATPEGETWSMERLRIAGREGGELGRFLLAFGRDREGEPYVCTNGSARASGSTGAVHRIVPAGGASRTEGTDAGREGGTGGEPTATATSQPGFGALTALGGIGLAGHLLARD